MMTNELFLNILEDLEKCSKSDVLECEKSDFLSVLTRIYPDIAVQYDDMIVNLTNKWN